MDSRDWIACQSSPNPMARRMRISRSMKDQMTAIFNAAIGMACLQDKDYAGAAQHLRITVDANPTDFSVVYPLGAGLPGDDSAGLSEWDLVCGAGGGGGSGRRRRRELKSTRARNT